MILGLLILFLIGCTSTERIRPYKNIDGTDLYYKLGSDKVGSHCEYDTEENNCLCSIQIKDDSSLEWLVRRAREHEWCQDFEKRLKIILSEKTNVTILGYDFAPSSGQVSKLQYFGAIKGTNDCIEWFVNDCKKLE